MASALNILLSLLVALLATSAFAASSCTTAGTCHESNGTCYTAFTSGDSYCSCRSGFSGSLCDTRVGGCDAQFATLNDTTSEYPPISVAASFTGDNFVVAIASPLVSQRNYTIVAVDDSAFAKESCTYPGLYWSRSFDSCHDIFTGVMPWANNSVCGWSVDNSSPSLAVYSAQMIVEHHDVTSPFINRTSGSDVERVTQHLVPLTISFPKNITVNSALTIQSPVRLLASISKQSVSADGSSATIELTTNLIWPYRLITPTMNNPGPATSYSISQVSISCPNDGTSSCTQVFRISIVTGAPTGACNLNGQYNLNWVLECQQVGGVEPAQCAIQIGDTSSASLVVISEDFCTTIATTTPLAGSLASFGDFAQSRPKTQFLVGQVVYFHANVTATNVTLTGTSINSVKLTSPGESDIILYSAGVVASPNTASFGTDASGNAFADFHFTVAAGIITALADDSSRVYTTRVIVDVDYQDTVTTKRGRRSVEFISNLDQTPVALGASFSVSDPQAAGAASVATGLAGFVAFVAALFCLF